MVPSCAARATFRAVPTLTTRFRLAQVLEQRGMTQYRLQKLSGVSMTTVQALYHNKTRMVSLDVLDALAKALNVAPGDLLERR